MQRPCTIAAMNRAQPTARVRSGQATGAMFFAIFGGAWCALWAQRTFEHAVPALAAIAVASAVLFVLADRDVRRERAALATEPETPERRRARRTFHWVNAAQWVVILVVGNVLANLGLSRWVVPMAMFVIGLHFFPLARVFASRQHVVIGSALVAIAVAYPFLAPAGPADPLGALAAGLVLWLAAASRVVLRREGGA